MAEQVGTAEVSIALDMKKNRIRIHKPTVRMLGDPKLIQLLFNPEDMVVAIVCPESEVPGGQEIRINPKHFKRGEARCSSKSCGAFMEIWMTTAPTA